METRKYSFVHQCTAKDLVTIHSATVHGATVHGSWLPLYSIRKSPASIDQPWSMHTPQSATISVFCTTNIYKNEMADYIYLTIKTVHIPMMMHDWIKHRNEIVGCGI